MSSNVTLVDKLNPKRFEPEKIECKIDKKCTELLLSKNNKVKNTEKKENFSINDVSRTKVSIDDTINKNKSVEEDEKNKTDLENFYVKYLLKLNYLINGAKKKLL